MGTFLAMSGLQGVTAQQVEDALTDYAQSKRMTFKRKAGSFDDDNILILRSDKGKHTVLYPNGFTEWDDASRFLSKALDVPVFSLHIHDGDLWMYILFVNGKEADKFNPIPDYWDEDVPAKEIKSWAGNAQTLARHWPGVTAKDVERYLVRWDLDAFDEEDGETKAYPKDEFGIGSDWQLLDIMRKLGLKYPISDKGKSTGTTFLFE